MSIDYKKDFENKIIGLDIGTTSLGWSVLGKKISLDKSDKDKWEIIDFGVRIWRAPEESKTLESNAQMRRGVRSQRRLSNRRKNRINYLKRYLNEINLVSSEEINNHFNKLKESNDYSVTNPKYKNDINPYQLRYKGLNEKLNPLQIGIVLLYYSKHRAYENKFDELLKKNDNRSSIELSKNLIEKYNYPIVSLIEDKEKFSKNGKDFYRNHKTSSFENEIQEILKNRENTEEQNEQIKQEQQREHVLFLRKDLIKEFDKLIETQSNYFDQLSEKNIEKIKDIIFSSRDFEDGPGPKDKKNREIWEKKLKTVFKPFTEMIGECSFIEGEQRTHSLSIIGDFWRIMSYISSIISINLIELINQDKFISDLTKNVLNRYLNEFNFNKTILVEEIEKITILDKTVIKAEIAKGINEDLNNLFLKTIKKTKLNIEHLKDNLNLDNIDFLLNNDLEKLGEIIYQNKTPYRLYKKTLNANLNLEELKDLESIKTWFQTNHHEFKQKVFSVSKKHIINTLQNSLENNQTVGMYHAVLTKENLKKLKSKDTKDFKIFDKFKDINMIKNAVVLRSLSQVRKVLKQLVKLYGHIDTVVVEVAKEFYNDKETRKKIRSEQDIKEKQNLQIKEQLKKFGISPTKSNQEKLKVFNSQLYKNSKDLAIDPYSLHKDQFDLIKIEDIFSAKYQVDHILPFSSSFDDSLDNKVLTSSNNNYLKGKKTPLEWIESNHLNRKAYISNVKKLFSKKYEEKINNLLSESKSNRQNSIVKKSSRINDTRYITTYVINYLNEEFIQFNKNKDQKQTKVQEVRGNITSSLRRIWLSDSIWGTWKKIRITPFNHSIDSIIVALANDKYEIFKIRMIEQITSLYFKFQSNYLNNKHEWNEYLIESLKKQIKNSLKIIDRYIENDSFEKNNYDLNKFNQKIDEIEEDLFKVIDLIYSLSEDRTKKYSKKELMNLEQIKSILKNEQILNLSKRIDNLIPVKIFEDQNQEIKFEKHIDKNEWKENNLNVNKQYPYVSYKIEAKIDSGFADQNPVSKKDYETSKNKDLFFEKEGNYYKKAAYFGLEYDPGQKKWFKKPTFDLVKERGELSKEAKLKLNHIYLPKLSTFVIDDQILALWGMMGGNTIVSSNLNLSYNNINKYKDIFNNWPLVSISALSKQENLKIVHFDVLGNIKGYRIIK